MSLLEDLFTKYGTDKGIWGYTPAYESHLENRRDSIRNVLEIGICGFRDIPNNVVGASLFAWRDYFPNAVVHGVDNDNRFMVNGQDRISTYCANAYNVESLGSAIKNFGGRRYDFICDDAVHDPIPQLALLQQLWPFVAPGGIYAIEELCPYKLPDNNEALFASLALAIAPDAGMLIYQTPKDERLAILRKQ